jgi:hypothetical protein
MILGITLVASQISSQKNIIERGEKNMKLQRLYTSYILL